MFVITKESFVADPDNTTFAIRCQTSDAGFRYLRASCQRAESGRGSRWQVRGM